MTGLEMMCGDDFCPGTDLNLEKMQRPLQNQKRTIIEQRQGRLNSVMADQHKARQK
jgi:hypothetical protein